VGLNALLALFAYRDFLSTRPHSEKALDTESWFFEPSDNSAPVVLILVLWLGMRRWKRFGALEGRPGAHAVTAALLTLGLAIFGWAIAAGAPDLQALSLLSLLMGFASWLGGPPAMRIAIVPAAILVFAMPLPAPLLNSVVWKFQIWTAEYSGVLLGLLGMPALVSGDQVLRSDSVFAIIETCSGLRSVETLTLLSVLMADLFGRRGRHALILVLVAGPLAFAINGFRALGLMLNPHSDIAVIHNGQGILMLLVGVLVLYAIDGLLARKLEPPSPRSAMKAVSRRDPVPRLVGIGAVLAAAALVSVALPAWDLPRADVVRPAEHVPLELDGWQGKDQAPDWVFLGKPGFRNVIDRSYRRGPERVSLFIGIGAIDERSRSLVSPKTGLPGSGWTVEEIRQEQLAGRDVTIRVVRRGTRRLLVHHWYEHTGGLAAESLRTLSAIDRSPWRRPVTPLVIRLSTPVGRGVESLRKAGDRLRVMTRLLERSLKELSTPRGAT
jgi:EpsI family protein